MPQITLEVLTAPNCGHCAAFKDAWAKIASAWPQVTYREASMMEARGREILMKYRILASPGIIVNDELFSTGPVDMDALRKRLETLSAPV